MKTSIINIANKDFVVLLNLDGVPLLMPNFYLITQKRNLSIKRLLYICTVFKRVYTFFQEHNKNLDDILINGEYDYLLKNILSFFQEYKPLNKLGNEAYNTHIFFVEEYIQWALKRYLLKNFHYKEKAQLESYYLERFYYLFKSFYIKKRINNSYKDIRIEHLENIISQYQRKNARSKNNNRNLIILQLLLESGMRIGEVLNLKTTDVVFSKNSYLKIIDHVNSNNDTRYDKPSIKNQQSNRVIFISDNLSEKIEDYILYDRRVTYKEQKSKVNHPFLFTSKLGKPLSKSSIQNIFNELNRVKDNDIINTKITPHKFRHSFAFSFLKYLVEIKKIDLERAQDELKKICGWSPGSKMPQFYAGKYIWEKANQHNIERINKDYTNEKQ
ncbi:hypothetical protein BBI01_07255 [Chryseobacterium artocarpi]|uniref:Tyr recombinase domain-containing protein n=1 Tax=Chryseobacterium artocarpi TaxID=1414727 RepID=A0A1B8ZK32_9FLAO|nr:site-specific integrase [Chryseobacterium artocarpi]OCA71946.1 hypothetical protein BBI01_07255 [Chryseobacterium artocarpi]